MKRVVSWTLAVFGLLISAGSGSAQDYQWRADAYNDAGNRGKYTAFLTQAVPETDDVAFRATCEPGSSGRFAPTVFVYNTGQLARDSQLSVSFFVAGRMVHEMQGLVYQPDLEEGIAGIMVRPGVNDPLWEILAANSYVRYEANGMGQAGMGKAGMNLSGSRAAIERFLSDCRGIFGIADGGSGEGNSQISQQQAQQQQRPPVRIAGEPRNEELNVSEARSCRKLGRIKSRNSNVPVSVRFTNRSGGYRSVMWLDYAGKPVQYRNLNPGESYTQQTFVGHPWMFTDGPGNCKEIFVPQRGSGSFDITFR